MIFLSFNKLRVQMSSPLNGLKTEKKKFKLKKILNQKKSSKLKHLWGLTLSNRSEKICPNKTVLKLKMFTKLYLFRYIQMLKFLLKSVLFLFYLCQNKIRIEIFLKSFLVLNLFLEFKMQMGRTISCGKLYVLNL